MQADLIPLASARAAKLRACGHKRAAEVLEACATALETAQAKVAALPVLHHAGDCLVRARVGWKCDCGADAANAARHEARQALGLPE